MPVYGGEILGVCGRRRSIAAVFQFGGTGDDRLLDAKLLSDGTIVALVQSKSTSFCGLDISAYTNGTYWAWGILKIDKDFELCAGTSWLLGSYWLTGNGYQMGYDYGRGPTIEVLNDLIYYTYGPTAAYAVANGWKVYAVDSTTMTLSLTSSASLDVYAGGINAAITHRIYGTDVYVVHNKSTNLSMLKQAAATLSGGSTSDIKGAGHLNRDMVVTASGCYVLSHNGNTMIKATLALAYSTERALGGTDSILRTCAAYGGYIYVSELYGNDPRIQTFSESTLAALVGYTGSVWKVVGAGGVAVFRGNSFIDGRHFLIGYNNEGAIGTYDLAFAELSPSTGAVITDAWVLYPDSSRVGQASAAFISTSPAVKLDTEEYLLCGYTNATVGGDNDCFLMKINADGRML